MRLKPHPPPSAQDVCFGSSVIIGPAPVDNVPPIRPYIDIEQVVISPTPSSLAITYRSGEQASLNLSVDRADATAEVDVGYATTDIPLSTFRSMWVADGNSDVDHVEANQGDFPILGSWTSLEGPSWFFYRQFLSTHNTSAPDISIELDTDADAFTDRIELLMGTDPLLACPATTNANDENPDPWPPDADDNQWANVGDVIALFKGVILNPINYRARSDFDADGDVDVGDLIAAFSGTIGTSCAA